MNHTAQPKLRHLPIIAGLLHHRRHRHRNPLAFDRQVPVLLAVRKVRADLAKVKPMPTGFVWFAIGIVPVTFALCAWIAPTPRPTQNRLGVQPHIVFATR